MGGLVAVRLAFAVSLTVIVCDPARSRVAEKVLLPLASVAFAGSTTPGELSLLVKCTVPAYAGSVLPQESWAVTLKEKLVPAVADGAAVVASVKWLAGAALTVTVSVAEWAPSVAVIVCDPALSSVAENVPCPLVKVESGGNTTPPDWSVLLKR